MEQVNVNPNPTFNGSFAFFWFGTGSDFADFLIGTPSNYKPGLIRGPIMDVINTTEALQQDSWHARPSLMLNFGLRWERMEYWSEKYNQIPTLVPGNSQRFIQMLRLGLFTPAIQESRTTLVPARNRFSPRFGLAYSPSTTNGTLGKVFGGRQNKHSGGVWNFLFGNPGQYHRYRRTTASLWTELHQARRPRCSLRHSLRRPMASSAGSLFQSLFRNSTGLPKAIQIPALTFLPSCPSRDSLRPIRGIHSLTTKLFLLDRTRIGSRNVGALSYVGSQAHPSAGGVFPRIQACPLCAWH